MRILYDGMIYLAQTTGGINRYFANLIKRLPVTEVPLLMVYQKREVNYPAHANLKVFRYRRLRPERVFFNFAKHYFRRVVSATDFDVAHPTYYTLLTQQEVTEYRRPVVITVHDMVHELFPAAMDPTGQHANAKRKAVMAATAVICVSENTKKDLLERYRLPEEKVIVIHHASEVSEALSYGDEQVPNRPYFLYVGARDAHKNFNGLLKAFAGVASVRNDPVLCVVGPPFTEVEKADIASMNLAHRIQTYSHVSDTHLAKLYRCSIGFVYPSLYEGFGIPPLEAMMCGTPVVASNTSSLPEVVGDAGLLFDPEATDDLADILLLLIDNPAQRDRLIARGRERARTFSWDRAAARTLEVYQSVV